MRGPWKQVLLSTSMSIRSFLMRQDTLKHSHHPFCFTWGDCGIEFVPVMQGLLSSTPWNHDRNLPFAGGIPHAHLWRYAFALVPLTGSMTSRKARAAYTAAFDALGQLLPPLQRSVRLPSGLDAMSAIQVGHLLLELPLVALYSPPCCMRPWEARIRHT